MRHGRKSRSHRFDGYKRHVLRDLDSGLVRAVGITPANVPEASVTEEVMADLTRQSVHLQEIHLDRGYLASDLVRDRPDDLAIYCKAWPVCNGDRYTKTAFVLNWDAGTIRCPNAVIIPFRPGATVRFPEDTCQVCPLRDRCTTSATGRSVHIHPDELLLRELRERQLTPQGEPSCENEHQSNTPWRTSVAGKDAAPATMAPARTSSTSGVAPSSTTCTPCSICRRPRPPDYLAGVLASP